MSAAALALLLAGALTGLPASAPESKAVERQLARRAAEMVPGSLEPLASPRLPPYRFFLFKEPSGQFKGAAVDGAEVALSDDAKSLARLFEATHFFEKRGADEALAIWTTLSQIGTVLGEADVAQVPAEDRSVVHPPKLEKAPGAMVVTGFIREAQEIYRVRLEIKATRVETEVKTLGELLKRDDVDEAARMLARGEDEVGRMAAASELGSVKEPRAFEALLKALGDSSPGVRQAATEALRRQCSETPKLKERTRGALQVARAGEKEPEVRELMDAALAGLKK